MPRELLGDRAYHAALRRLGVKNPGDVPIGVPVQLTAKVDDLSHLAEPLGLDIWAWGGQIAAVAGQYAGFTIRASGGGLYWRCHTSEFLVCHIDDDDTIPAEAFQIASPFSGSARLGILPQAQISTGQGNLASWPTRGNAWRWFGNGGIDTLMFPDWTYLGPGRRLIMRQFTANDVFDYSIMWREVPSPGG